MILLALLGVAGCAGSSREAIGLRVPPPDEFLVVSRKPLTLPADMTALPPPRPGAPSRVDPDPVAQAQAALTGVAPTAVASAAPTAGEQALLGAAGAAAPDPAIRQTLVAEAPVPERRFGLDSFLGFPIDQTMGAGDAERLSPTEEAARLREEGVVAPIPPAPPTPPGQ
jgi:hypothetical protein